FMMIGLHMLQATMTMTGLLGVILTLGMAVDANVLIFERMRDEKASGASSWTVLDIGVSKAADTIIDSNLTTMIIGVVLFVMGSSIVRGFAITLILGLITSMISAIWGTKVFLALLYRNEIYPVIDLEPIKRGEQS
ncbi:MAG: protein translocase subunit SecD, partial [Gammaproteobacteria bacterium]|nr:protein translocase subunit SecD [Gammaproteobacteria bacterium]